MYRAFSKEIFYYLFIGLSYYIVFFIWVLFDFFKLFKYFHPNNDYLLYGS